MRFRAFFHVWELNEEWCGVLPRVYLHVHLRIVKQADEVDDNEFCAVLAKRVFI
jgi:hypothetical protein